MLPRDNFPQAKITETEKTNLRYTLLQATFLVYYVGLIKDSKGFRLVNGIVNMPSGHVTYPY